MDTWLRKLLAARFPDYEHEIEHAWTDDTADGVGVWLCLNNGPWLVAELRKVEKQVREEEAEGLQLEDAA